MTDTPESQGASISDLALHDQILHGIGRVAQAQVQLEIGLRQLYVSMTLPSPARYLIGKRSLTQLAQDCQVLLIHSSQPDELKTDGRDAIQAAIDADRLRHRVVHDWWRQKLEPNDPNAAPYERTRVDKNDPIAYTGGPADLSYIDNAEDELRRAFVRVQALWMATVLAILGDQPAAGPTVEELLPEIRGEITLLSNGGYRVD